MRPAALFVVLLMAVSAAGTEWFECAGWSTSAAMRHACCQTMTHGGDNAANSCCALAQQSRDQNSGQSRTTAPAPVLVATIDLATSFGAVASSAGFVAHQYAWPPGHSAVPLYVQHHTLLI